MSIDINRSIREKKKNYSLPYAFVCSVKETPKKGKRVKARRKGKDARHGQCLEDQSVAHITLPKYVDGGAASRVQAEMALPLLANTVADGIYQIVSVLLYLRCLCTIATCERGQRTPCVPLTPLCYHAANEQQ